MRDMARYALVSTHSRPKAAGVPKFKNPFTVVVSTHSRPKAAGNSRSQGYVVYPVSTHSRPKAAGSAPICRPPASIGFNSQPPEGGWPPFACNTLITQRFQLTAARRRLVFPGLLPHKISGFQLTAARRRLGVSAWLSPPLLAFQLTAARRRLVWTFSGRTVDYVVSTHSRPKAAGAVHSGNVDLLDVSTHSRPKAAGNLFRTADAFWHAVSTHSRPKAAGLPDNIIFQATSFQLTAARRRLGWIRN